MLSPSFSFDFLLDFLSVFCSRKCGVDAICHLVDGVCGVNNGDLVANGIQHREEGITHRAEDLLGLVDLDRIGGSVASDTSKALLWLKIKEDTDIGSADLGAIQVHCLDPLKVGLRALICQRGIIVAVANNIEAVIKHFLNTVDGIDIVMDAVKKAGVRLLPVDSEHSAIFQCLQGCPPQRRIKRLILTASGGPFFGRSAEDLEQVTLADALNHPNWSMGQKITIDSATMMNKGLELIEASWLFDIPPQEIDIVVHRESVIHSLVEYDDNAVLAQLGTPDMRVPIQYALTYPDRLPCPAKQLRLEDWNKLTFYAPDDAAFPAINLARKALTMGGLYPAALNAANEVAVSAFIGGEIRFTDITRLTAAALDMPLDTPKTVEDVFAVDAEVRRATRFAIDAMK